jgi:steroid delta-isomerase-like uncharacterized protein
MDSPDTQGGVTLSARSKEREGSRQDAPGRTTDAGVIHGFLARWAQALNSHDLHELEALLTDDVVWADPAMFGETVHGRAEVRAFHETLLDGFPDVRFQSVSSPHAALEGEGVAQRWRMTGTFTGDLKLWGKRARAPAYAPNGRSLDIEIVSFYEFRAGQVCRWTIHYDLLGFSQQIGILPPADSRMLPLVVRAQRLIAKGQTRRTASERSRG